MVAGPVLPRNEIRRKTRRRPLIRCYANRPQRYTDSLLRKPHPPAPPTQNHYAGAATTALPKRSWSDRTSRVLDRSAIAASHAADAADSVVQ